MRKIILSLIFILALPSFSFSVQEVVWGWKNLGDEEIAYNGAANCTSGFSKCPDDGFNYRGEKERTLFAGSTPSVFYTDHFNRVFRFNVKDTVETTVKGKVTIYKNDTKVIEYITGLVSDETEAPYGDILFTIGQAVGDGEYLTGDDETTIGDYGQSNAIKFCVSSCDSGNSCGAETCSDGGVDFAGAGVGFYTPPYFMTTYPDEFDAEEHTGEHYTLLQDVTSTSAYVVVNTPNLIAGYIRIEYGETDSYGEVSSAVGLTGIQKILLTDLTENTLYHYRLLWRSFGDDTSDQYGQDKTFTTLKPAGSDVRFIIFADTHLVWRNSSDVLLSKGIFKKVKEYNPDFIIDIGDTQGGDNGLAFFQEQFDSLYSLNNALFQYVDIPIQFDIPGNHEAFGSYLQNVIDPEEISVPFHDQPWINPIYAGTSREKYFANIDHGESLSLDHKTFASWESGDAVFICTDPYSYTDVYPTNCDTNCTFTYGPDQEAWVANILATTTKKWKFIFSHQHLGGENRSDPGKGCYGKSGASGFHRGQNLTELYPYIKDPKHTVLFLGHDHMLAIDKYEDLHIVHAPASGLWTAGQTWNQNKAGYDVSRKFQGSGKSWAGASHGYFNASLLVAPTNQGAYYSITYTNESGVEALDTPERDKPAIAIFQPETLTNITQNKQVDIYYEAGENWEDTIDTTLKTIRILQDSFQPENMEGWLPSDEIAILHNQPGFLVVDFDSEKVVMEMVDLDGVPVPNTRLILK